jgi:hypothetical protein
MPSHGSISLGSSWYVLIVPEIVSDKLIVTDFLLALRLPTSICLRSP